MKAVKIPYDQLSPEVLHGVIEEFVTRDGTDYGEVEIPLEKKLHGSFPVENKISTAYPWEDS